MYGRRQTSEAIDATQRVIKRTQEIAREHRHVLNRDHHEGYIGWETYEQIQACIATNRRPTPRHVAFAVGSEIAVYPME